MVHDTQKGGRGRGSYIAQYSRDSIAMVWTMQVGGQYKDD